MAGEDVFILASICQLLILCSVLIRLCFLLLSHCCSIACLFYMLCLNYFMLLLQDALGIIS